MLPQIITVNPFMSTRKRRRHRIKNTFRRRHSRRHHNPESRRARRRAARSGWHMRRRAHNPYRHRRHRAKNLFGMHRRRRHNPDMTANLSQDLIAAGIGAASAVVVDVALAYAPIPAGWASGWGQVLTQGVGSILVGMAAGMIGGQRMGALATVGGLTVTAYGALQLALGPTVGQNIKGFGGLADFSDFGRMPRRVGAYIAPNPGLPVLSTAGGARARTMSGVRGRVGAYMPGARLAPAPTTALAKKQIGAYMRSSAMGRFSGFGGFHPRDF